MRGLSLCALVCLMMAACAPGRPAATTRHPLTVFAAASLADAFTALEADYEAKFPATDVIFNFVGSQQLARQLVEGAPADLFASANTQQMDLVVESGRVDAGAVRFFAANRLIILTPAENPAAVRGMIDLAKPELKLVLAAEAVPAGHYSLVSLQLASARAEFGPGYRAAVLANVVSYEENVRAVVNKVLLGEADAGIVYASDVSGDMAARVATVPIPDELNVIASYPVAVVRDSARPAEAQEFVDLLLSPEGQAVLAENGFLPPEPSSNVN